MAALVGAAISVVVNGIVNSINGQGFFENWGTAAIIGAVSGAYAHGIGEAVKGLSGVMKVAVQAVAHGHMGGIISAYQGGAYGTGFLSGSFGSIMASGAGLALHGAKKAWRAAGMILAGGVSGGVGSSISGGNFWHGVRNGLISGTLNHVAHSVLQVDPAKLKKRILADGKLTWKEATEWFRHGRGEALLVDADTVELDFINPDDWAVGQRNTVQTLMKSVSGRVCGNLSVEYMGNNKFSGSMGKPRSRQFATRVDIHYFPMFMPTK